MLDNFSLCSVCNELIEKRKGIWWTTAYDTCVGPEENGHKHSPIEPSSYHSYKYGYDVRTEILSVMGDFSFDIDCLGDSETFGYYEFFEDFAAIIEYDSQGFVYSTFYDTPVMARNAWAHLSTDYDEWCDDNDSCESYETDEYDSDLWDIRS